MRDAVTLEARGIPTILLVNDVFEPIAHATAALLALPPDYVARNVVWLPHPTSNLAPEAAAALVDERIDTIRRALAGGVAAADATGKPAHRGSHDLVVHDANGAALATARAGVDGLVRSLAADGAELVLLALEGGVLRGELRLGGVTCDDGSCVMPAAQLEAMIAAMLVPKIAGLDAVSLREIQ
jgi:DNA-binding transcriptional regulator YdaS (Cro superfamily)